MKKDDPAIDDLTHVFQELIDKEHNLYAPTPENPICVKHEQDTVVVEIHASLERKLVQYAKLKEIPLDQARAEFAAMVVPVIGQKVRLERKASKVIPIKVAKDHVVPDNAFAATGTVLPRGAFGIDASVLKPQRHVLSSVVRSTTPTVSPNIWGPDSPRAKVIRREQKRLRNIIRTTAERIRSTPDYQEPAVEGARVTPPPPTGIQRSTDHDLLLQQMELRVDARLKEQGEDLRKILEEVLTKKSPLLSLRLFEGRFFSPQITNGEANESAITWKATIVNGLKASVHLTVKSLVSVSISAGLLWGATHIGHMFKPDAVPAPSTIAQVVAKQFTDGNFEVEMSSEGVKFTAKKGGKEDDTEVERLMATIGGDRAPIVKQKELVKYLEAKYGEGLLSGKPIIKATVVEGVRERVQKNDESITRKLKEQVLPSKTAGADVPPTADAGPMP